MKSNSIQLIRMKRNTNCYVHFAIKKLVNKIEINYEHKFKLKLACIHFNKLVRYVCFFIFELFSKFLFVLLDFEN